MDSVQSYVPGTLWWLTTRQIMIITAAEMEPGMIILKDREAGMDPQMTGMEMETTGMKMKATIETTKFNSIIYIYNNK